jgi:serine/threonine protein kinase
MAGRGSDSDELARLVGSTVAQKYRVERLLGRGGMGAVFSATNTAIGKRVALKFLTREAARDRDAASRFQREARAASVAESEHIVHVFDEGLSDDGHPFLVMELLVGEDLRSRLERETRLGVGTAVAIASQILRGLMRAHGAGLVHRDLKPDNVFLCRRDDGSLLVKLVDFGISKLSQKTTPDTLTQRGAVIGTAHYMSPEQVQAPESVDPRADLYGVGAILFEALSGRSPHEASSYEAVLVAICTRDAPDVRALRPDVREPLAQVIARALSRDREARFQSAEEFLTALTRAEPSDGAIEPGPSEHHTGTSRATWTHGETEERKKSSRLTLVAAVISTLVGFSVAAFWVQKQARDQTDSEPRPASSTPPSAITNAATPAANPIVTPIATAAAIASAPPPASVTTTSRVRPPTPSPAASTRPKSKEKRSGVAGSLELSTREP